MYSVKCRPNTAAFNCQVIKDVQRTLNKNFYEAFPESFITSASIPWTVDMESIEVPFLRLDLCMSYKIIRTLVDIDFKVFFLKMFADVTTGVVSISEVVNYIRVRSRKRFIVNYAIV